jgi:FAD/FMN-containing dehydrogenase/Fe-S oxidoreductase
MNALHQDLAALTAGEVYTDALTRELYATAACIYRIRPRAVVCPRTAGEVAAIVAYAAERGLPVTARGAGSAVAGQTLGPGIIIDFSRHLNQILAVNREKREAIVEPGVILGQLNRALAADGLRFPPDPSSGDYATVGGMIANNSSGPHSLKYGDTRAWTARVKAVLADGTITWLEPKPALPPALGDSAALEDRIYARLPALLREHAAAIARSRPRTRKNSSGYHVWDLLGDDRLDPTPLIVGSEGTLALVVKAALKLAPLPAATSGALLAFADLEATCAAVSSLTALAPAALEIIDDQFLAAVREHRPDLRALLPPEARAVLLIEFEADSEAEAEELLARTAALGLPMTAARNRAELNELFALRKAASPLLYRLPGRRLTRFVEDVTVPPERLHEAMTGIRAILARHGTSAPILGHAGSGNLHLNPRLNLEQPDDLARMRAIADEVYAMVIALGGSISGEHGDGLLRAPYVKLQFPELMPLFHAVKDLFDPRGILNPGKKLSDADSIPTEPLRFGAPDSGPGLEAEVLEALRRCHGCGLCRTYCPVAAATATESGLPRARVGAMRAATLGDLDPDAPDLASLLDQCTHCQRCLAGCPTGIEVSSLVRGFRRHYRPRPPWRDRVFARYPAFLAASAHAPGLAAAANDSRWLRTVAQHGLGVDARAPLPCPAGDALRAITSPPASASGRRVVLYPGCLGRYADGDEETAATAEILRALGWEVLLPDLPCCGEARLLLGEVEAARRHARRLTERLREYAAHHVPVVTNCPTCALGIRLSYPALLGQPAQPAASGVRHLFEFLAESGWPEAPPIFPRPAPLGRALLHRGCHLTALGPDRIAPILNRIEGLDLAVADDACCGLAGSFGVKIDHAHLSRALAETLLRRAAEAGTETVISPCPSCRRQVRALGLKPISPVLLLLSVVASAAASDQNKSHETDPP